MHMRLAIPLLLVAAVAGSARADGLTVLTVDKVATFKRGRGVVRVGRDPRLAQAPSPLCPTQTAVEISSYPEPTQRVVVATTVALDCARWRAKRGEFVYDDPAATGGVRSVRYGRSGLLMRFGGKEFVPPTGPVGYVQAWFTVGGTRFNARLHNFKRNAPGALVSRKPSAAAATGERAFWSVLHHDWQNPADEASLEATALDCFTKAARADKRDGWSRFLLGMTHLYRFGQDVDRYDAFSDFARGEIEAAYTAFQQAVPRLWDPGTRRGDSRVPGFAASATFTLGLVRNDPALQAAGLAALDEAFAVNPFFNVFDYIPVAQGLPAFDPRFQPVFDKMNEYLNDPATLACVSTQPEMCANAGYAPRNFAGSLALFGDMNAKAGDAAAARQWYDLALGLASGDPPYRFLPALQERVATVDQRVALLRDTDPANDPTMIGARAEACAACHTR
jgi:tetratricopeptide (TPR) repeat protein